MGAIANKLKSALRETREELAADWQFILLLTLIIYALRYWIVIALLVMVVSSSVEAQPSTVVGEELLRYKVKWGFIRIGTMTVQRKINPGREGTFHYVLKAESDPTIPFVDVFFVNSASLRRQSLLSAEFKSVIGRDGQTRSLHYTDSTERQMRLEEYAGERLIYRDSIEMNEPIYDDLGLFEFFRRSAGSSSSKTVASTMEREIKHTLFTFPSEIESIEVSALDGPCAAFRFTGKANWTRSDYAGLKGEFCGWVSADAAKIPLRIEAKIFLGSIILELESFESPGWTQGAQLIAVGGHP